MKIRKRHKELELVHLIKFTLSVLLCIIFVSIMIIVLCFFAISFFDWVILCQNLKQVTLMLHFPTYHRLPSYVYGLSDCIRFNFTPARTLSIFSMISYMMFEAHQVANRNYVINKILFGHLIIIILFISLTSLSYNFMYDSDILLLLF